MTHVRGGRRKLRKLALTTIGVVWFALAHFLVQRYAGSCDDIGGGAPAAAAIVVLPLMLAGLVTFIACAHIFDNLVRSRHRSTIAIKSLNVALLIAIAFALTWTYLMMVLYAGTDPSAYSLNCGDSQPSWWPDFLPAPYPLGMHGLR